MDTYALFDEGLLHHQNGNLDLAEHCYRGVLLEQPTHTNALHHLGLIHLARGEIDKAILRIKASISLEPKQPDALANLGHCLNAAGNYKASSKFCRKALHLDSNNAAAWTNLGNAQRGLKALDDARASFERALEIEAFNPQYKFNLAITLLDLKKFAQATELFKQCLCIDQNIAEAYEGLVRCQIALGDFESAREGIEAAIANLGENQKTWTLHGNVLRALSRHEEALTSYRKALSLGSENAEVWNYLGTALLSLTRYEEALASYDRALQLCPTSAPTWNNHGVTLGQMRRYDAALRSYANAQALLPGYADAWINSGNALCDLQRHEEALSHYRKAAECDPLNSAVWNNQGTALYELRRFKEALSCYTQATKLKPNHAHAWNNSGVALNQLKEYVRSQECLRTAIQIDPLYAEAFVNLAVSQKGVGDLEQACANYTRAIEINPGAEFILGDALHTNLQICDWTDFKRRCQQIEECINRGEKAAPPFVCLGLFDSPTIQRGAAEVYAEAMEVPSADRAHLSRPRKSDRLKIAYFSADFYNHATMYLIADLLEHHDREKFEVYGFSLSAHEQDDMRLRAEASMDHFFDVSDLSDQAVADLSRREGVHIAIDLKGYTQYSRPRIFNYRAAPIQISYLGYPGTMGSSSIDYLLADHCLIPEEHRPDYLEKIIYLPNSYQPNDSKRKISSQTHHRTDLGLPEDEFVFCCFNNNWKILPQRFDTWARIVHAVPNSVLWLYEDNPVAANNLRKEAETRGLDPSRLVFAKHAPHEKHLARLRQADLFLDTYPYGAHTTASDALWSDLPVITRVGRSFASRVAGSLLSAIGLPDMVVATEAEYEALAIDLANDRTRMAAIKKRIQENKKTAPLFDTNNLVRHIETSYRMAYERHEAALAPIHLEINS